MFYALQTSPCPALHTRTFFQNRQLLRTNTSIGAPVSPTPAGSGSSIHRIFNRAASLSVLVAFHHPEVIGIRNRFALCLAPKCLKAHQPIPEHKTGKDLRLVLHRGALWIVCHVQECFLHDVGIIHCTLDGSGLRRAKPFHQSGVVPNDHRGDGGRIFTAASVSHLVLSELITTFVVGSGVILRNCSKIRGGVILSRILFLQPTMVGSGLPQIHSSYRMRFCRRRASLLRGCKGPCQNRSRKNSGSVRRRCRPRLSLRGL